MSWEVCNEPQCGDAPAGGIETVITPRATDLGAFAVRRALPSARRKMVGPFIFFDQMGPAEFLAGRGIDVRPHPHIGLATLTYLFSGEIAHRDSLGVHQVIAPGAANLMTAGRGIVHSERTPAEARNGASTLFGAQMWLALPKTHEEGDAAFIHHAKSELPVIDAERMRARVIAGAAFGAKSPLLFPWETLCVDVEAQEGAKLPLEKETEERAVYVMAGEIAIAGDRYAEGRLLVFRPGDALSVLVTRGPARLMVLGGAPMDGPRHIWWNFVSSDPERIEQAKVDWREGRFGGVPGETEFIPLPDK